MGKRRIYSIRNQSRQTKITMAKKFNTRKWLQAGALATDALSKGSAGGLGKVLAESKIDLSGRNPSGTKRVGKFAPDPKTEVNEWMPEKEILGDFPSKKNSNYNV